jgi:ubiquinone/menaquinone biosynthesis C-methylase UbiE
MKNDAPHAAAKYPGLEKQPAAQNIGKTRQAIRRFLRDQFGRPSGLVGSLFGKIMALRPSNKERGEWTISLLQIKPNDRLLEIGFGPGFAIERAFKTASPAFIAGVDHSDVMVRQAGARNAEALRAGKLELHLGSASQLPKFKEKFDKIYTINSIHFWTEPVECLKNMRAMLKPGGLMAVTLQPRSQAANDDVAKEIGGEVAKNLERAGFTQIRLEMRKMKPVSAMCALGINPGP